MQGLARSCDITKPFSDDEDFDWNAVLRKDVFALAMRHNSFSLFNKEKVLRKVVKKKRYSLLPLMDNAGWQLSKNLINKLLNNLSDNSDVEYRAWLLNYKNCNYSFAEDKVDL